MINLHKSNAEKLNFDKVAETLLSPSFLKCRDKSVAATNFLFFFLKSCKSGATTLCLLLVVFFSAPALALELTPASSRLKVENESCLFIYSIEDGSFDLASKGGEVVVRQARSGAALAPPGTRGVELELGSHQCRSRSWESEEISDELGDGLELRVFCQSPVGPSLVSVFRFYEGKRFITIQLVLKDFPESLDAWKVKSLDPMKVMGPAGGLFLGPNPQNAVILENGSNLYFDFMVSMFRAGEGPPFPASLFSRNSRSDWSSVIYDPDTGRSALAGFLSGDETGLVVAGDNPLRSGREAGRRGFSDWAGLWNFRPPQSADRELASGVLYLDLLAPTPFTALEDYAEAVAKWNRVTPWSDVPTGWNSWGEYYSDINEQIILDNLEFAARHFLPYGMKYFQIDSGYSPHWGDWEADPVRFPHGLGWLADRIREKGMIPGIWIAPANAEADSELAREHPDWLMPEGGLREKLLIGDEGMRVLDFAKPEVREHLRGIVRKYTKDWGYKWLKVDFAYQYLMHVDAGDAHETGPDYYRKVMRLIKEEAGPDVFVLGIGVAGLNYGLADGQRLGLDNMPAWTNQRSFFDKRKMNFTQGLVPTARTIARRYWLNRRIWINHPDLIYFNNDRGPDWSEEPLRFDEALCFASLIGFSGGIVKIGDRMVEMTPEEIAVIQKLLPVYPGFGRPLDLFEKETPELWDLEVKTGFETWHVLGLWNWGENWERGKHLPEARRTVSVEFSRLGLDPDKKYLVFDFWGEELLGEFGNKISLDIEPRTVKILAVRERPTHPGFLSSNRHFTQGGVELKNVAWNEGREVLSVDQDAVPGHEYHVYLYCPPGYSFDRASAGDLAISASQSGTLVRLSFTTDENKLSWQAFFSTSRDQQ